MSEKLFRGKQKINGEWVEGCGIMATENWASIITVKDNLDENYSDIEEYEVIPETVGQFTGVPDKSGTNIFEGDILRDDDNEENGVVEFDEGEYIVVFGNVCTRGIADIARSCYVFGNKHDNPELIN